MGREGLAEDEDTEDRNSDSDNTQHRHDKKCKHNVLNDDFEQEYCREINISDDKKRDPLGDTRKYSRSSIQEKARMNKQLIVKNQNEEEEENQRIENEYYEWEQRRQEQETAEDYQTMNMRKYYGREQHRKPTNASNRGNRRTLFGHRNHGHDRTSDNPRHKRAMKGEDGAYRDMSGNILQQISMITGKIEPVVTTDDLKRYYKYYNS